MQTIEPTRLKGNVIVERFDDSTFELGGISITEHPSIIEGMLRKALNGSIAEKLSDGKPRYVEVIGDIERTNKAIRMSAIVAYIDPLEASIGDWVYFHGRTDATVTLNDRVFIKDKDFIYLRKS